MDRSREWNSGDGKAFAAAHEPMQVLYVHGLFLRGREAWALRYRLRCGGLALRRFRYDSRGEPPERAAVRLAEILGGEPELHVIGHSLGGMIALAAVANLGPAWRGRAVLLAPPLAGSGCARRVAGLWGGRRVLGATRDWLCGGLPPDLQLPDGRLALVAGTFNYGVGTLLRACPAPGDGVVSVPETRIEGMPDPLLVNTTHLGLLFSRRVAGAASRFLRGAASGVAPGSPGAVAAPD